MRTKINNLKIKNMNIRNVKEAKILNQVVKVKNEGNSVFISATDFVKIINPLRLKKKQITFSLSEWLRTERTVNFMEELTFTFKTPVKQSEKGRHANIWLHPILFIDLINKAYPSLKIKDIDWLYDILRNEAPLENFIFMELLNGVLFKRINNKSDFDKYQKRVGLRLLGEIGIQDIRLANKSQLQLLENIVVQITRLTYLLTDIDMAVELGIELGRI